MINYKRILLSYIDAVATESGATFTMDAEGLTTEEFAELMKLDKISASLPPIAKSNREQYSAMLDELVRL